MTTIAARAVAIGTALAEHPDLPQSNLFVGSMISSIAAPGYELEGVGAVAAWANRFSTPVVVSLSSYGIGKVQTDIELGGIPVSVDCNIGTAQAYELGRILQRELNKDVSIHIGADELLAAIDQVVPSE